MTYSIVARDPQTRLLGVAVQTAMFAAGASVPWARAGVGAVAAQAIAEPAYGPRCLDAIQAGASAQAALAQAQAADEAALLRQVGVVAADGSVAAMTGEWCIDHAGHLLGDGFAVQANMMASPAVWPALAEAFGQSPEPFPRRLLAALEAGQAAGGDARGMMAAALVVVEAEPRDWRAGRLVDLRVDRGDAPLAELRRLLDASEAYAGFSRAVGALFSGDAAAAVASADEGLSMLPGEENLRFVRAGALAASGEAGSAAAELRELVPARPSWENPHPQLRRQGPDHAAAARPGGAAGVTGRGRQASPAGKTGSASATWPAGTRVPWTPAKRNRRPPRRRNGLARRHHPARPHPQARRPGRAGPAPPRRTRPGSPYRPLPRICDGEPQMPVPGRLVSHAGGRGSHRYPDPDMMPDPAGDPGHSGFGLEPHDHLRISRDRP